MQQAAPLRYAEATFQSLDLQAKLEVILRSEESESQEGLVGAVRPERETQELVAAISGYEETAQTSRANIASKYRYDDVATGASSREVQISTSLDSADVERRVSLHEIECKATLCRLSYESSFDGAGEDPFDLSWPAELARETGKDLAIYLGENEGNLRTVYIEFQ